MKKEKVVSRIILLISCIILLFSNIAFAKEYSEPEIKYSKAYEEWLKLPKSTREKISMPPMFDVPYYERDSESNDYFENQYSSIMRAIAEDTEEYRLDENGVNLKVKDQGYTNECWAFSLTSVLETTCYRVCEELVGLEFSPRHIDYSTVSKFLDKTIQIDTWGREVGEGGNFEIGLAYIVSGKGPVLEEDMPLVVDKVEELIDSSEIEGKEVQAKVKEAVYFPTIYKYKDGNQIEYRDSYNSAGNVLTEEEAMENRIAIKEHIMTYGAVYTQISGDLYPYLNMSTGAFNSNSNMPGHAVTIIGWDDNYSKDNFNDGYKPSKDGAWIVLNSYGTKDDCVVDGMEDYVGDGFYYVSYEDSLVEAGVRGIREITQIDHDYLYQYDLTKSTATISLENGKKIKIDFDKKSQNDKESNEVEKITEIGLFAEEEMYVAIKYGNNLGTMIEENDLIEIAPKTKIYPGYNTIKLDEPKEIEEDTYSIIVEVYSVDGSEVAIPVEVPYGSKNPSISQRCSYQLYTTGKTYGFRKSTDSDFCIKVFTRNEPKELIEPESVSLNESEITLDEGETFSLKATILPDNTNIKNKLTWESSDEDILIVSQDGEIEAKKEGRADVIVTTENNKKATCTVIVNKKIVEAESISLNQNEISIEEGKTYKLEAQVLPDNTTDKSITWNSQNIEIAEVDNAGNVTGIKEGTTKIIARTNNGIEATCNINVIPRKIQVDSISLNKSEETIIKGNSITLTAEILPYDATDKTITWKSSNENVAKVIDGTVYAINEGEAVITVESSNNKTATCNITVILDPLKPREIIVDEENVEITEGLNYQIQSSIIPDTAPQEISWISNNSAIASVDSSGLIKGLIPGETEIIGTSTANQEITKVIKVRVLEKEIKDIVISKLPDKLTYIQNYENLDLTGGKIKIIYNNNTYDEINMDSNLVVADGFSNLELGTLRIYVYYEHDKSKVLSFDVQIIPVEIENIEVGTYPTKTTYIAEGENIDLTGGTLIIYYNNKTKKEVKMTDLNIFSYDIRDENGKRMLYVTLLYNDIEVPISYEIKLREISSITLQTLPTKTIYYIGEEVNLDGGEILITYTDGYTEIVKMSDENCTIASFDSSTSGNKRIAVIYNGKLLMFDVVVTDNTSEVVEKIEIENLPQKLEYLKNTDELDLTGGSILITYLNGQKKSKSMQDSEVIVEGFNNNVLGDRVLTVKYDGKTTTFTVKIVDEYEIAKIILTEPIKKEYIVKEETTLNLDGGYITIKYKNGSPDKIVNLTDENIIITGFDGNVIGEQVITINYKGNRLTFKVNVVRVIERISINKLPDKIEYNQTDTLLDLTGGSILVEYNDGYKEIIDMTDARINVSGFVAGTPGIQNIVIRYNNNEITFPVLVSKEIKSIAVKTKPTKEKYVQGIDNLDLTGGVLLVTYSDDSTSEINLPSDKVTVSGFDNTKLGLQIITLEYKGKLASFSIEIIKEEIPKTVQEIIIKTLPSKLKYVVWKDELDLTGGVLKVIYSDGTESEVEMTDSRVVVLGFSNERLGKRTLTISFEGKTVNFDIEIIEEVIEKKEIEKIEFISLPTKLEYEIGENLDLTDGKIKVTYIDGTTSVIDLSDEKIIISGYDNSKEGIQTIYVTYEKKRLQFNVTVVDEKVDEKIIQSIKIKKLPNKVSYNLNEDLNLEGGMIEVSYLDGTKEEIPMTDSSVTITGYDKQRTGTQTLTVNYKNKLATFSVTVKEETDDDGNDEVTITKISVKTRPTKTSYKVGEELNLEGGILEVTYSDGSVEEVPLTDSKVKISGYDNNKIGMQLVTVSYENKLATFSVQVSENKEPEEGNDEPSNVKSITIKKLPNKTTYKTGEELDLKGGIIEVTYLDGTKEEIPMTDSKVTVNGYNTFEEGVQQLTLRYEGKETTLTVKVEKGENSSSLNDEKEESDDSNNSNDEKETNNREDADDNYNKEERKAVDTGDNIETYIISLIISFTVIVIISRIIKKI